jgi:enediyne biosynthesis protein E4
MLPAIDELRVRRNSRVLQNLRLIALIGATCVSPIQLMCQTTPPAPAQRDSVQQGMGVSTKGVFKPVLDAEHRPITAGGFVDKGPVVFQNIEKQAGLTSWHHTEGTIQKQLIPETLGGGVALIDYDNDGWLDIYFVNSLTYDGLSGKDKPTHAALFHNNHDGTFTDAAEKAGVQNDRWGVGVAVGDYDNDGWPDMYVTNYGKNRLYHNNHNGTFTDVAAKAGVDLGIWSTGPTFGDYDGDGRLDLFVPGYVHFDGNQPPLPGSAATKGLSNCQFRGIQVMCGPRGLTGEHDHLFHNNGDGTFTDVSLRAGVSDLHAFYGLASAFVDLNDDGKVDLVIADDSTPNYLYINKGNGTFDDASYISGYALNQEGRETASMGIAIGDYQNSGRLSVANTDFSDDYDVLYRNDGDGNFTDVSYQAGIAAPTIPFLGWGDGFLDYDNDGLLDLMLINGHVYPAVDKTDWGTTFAQRPLLFHNLDGKSFELVPPVRNTGLAAVIAGRGAAFGDLFNDGKVDVVINNMDSTPTLLRNVNTDTHHWVAFRLVGGPKSPRDAIGASIYLTAGDLHERGDVISGGSYASSNDLRVHFGLGTHTSIDKVEIHWPSGLRETIAVKAKDSIYTVEEGKGVIGELCTSCGSRPNSNGTANSTSVKK